MKEVSLYKKLDDKKVQCQNCPHFCIIAPNKRGICGVKENKNGKLFSLVYEKACSLEIDPIEKKPFFHFMPGTHSLSVATVGCQFACHSCQNWQISQAPKLIKKIEGENISLKQIIKTAKDNKLPSISYTYTDPVIFSEYALDTMKLAKKEGLKNAWITSGFLSKKLFSLISPFLDAANVDLKSFDDNFYRQYCGGRLDPVLDTLIRMKEKKIWIEITTLVIPGLNDSEENFKKTAQFIKKELGSETPWHLSRFSGAISWKLKNVPDTPIKTLEKAYEIGKKSGLKYVYLGNVFSLSQENTFCPKCQAKMIERIGYTIQRYDKNGKCAKCGTSLNIIE